MSFEIIVYGNEVLKKTAAPLETVTPALKGVVDDMVEVMYANRGVGLAAPQVGISKRLVVLDVDQVKKTSRGIPDRRLQVFLNPEILWESEQDSPYVEGCLSVPGIEGKIYRPGMVRIRYRDLDFKEREIEADELLARVIQHEIDHLNGILFVDRLSFTQRTRIAGKLSRLRKKNQSEKRPGEKGVSGLII